MAKARILAIDDQLYFRVFLEDLLAQEGYEVRTASGPDEAFELLDQEDFEIVLTDLVMPGVEGTRFVEQLKERMPEGDVVVVSSVGDVRTAVEAMKVGATEYLLKPIDRAVVAQALSSILRRRHMDEEHARLMAENLEFMGAFSLYERALGLFSELSVEPLADRVVEGLCLETGAQSGVFWLARGGDPGRLGLVGVRGLVRAVDESEELVVADLPPDMAVLKEPEVGITPALGAGESSDVLYVPFRQAGRLLGVVRLTDRLDGGRFGEVEWNAAERFSAVAAQAVANALHVDGLERRSFRDPVTKAYTRAYLDDVARGELQKASRFGRTFSLLLVELDGVGELRRALPQAEFARWLEGAAYQLGRSLRTTDVLATEREGRFCLLLPETHAVGAGVLKRRMQRALADSASFRDLPDDGRPRVRTAAASFPSDGSQLDALWRRLEERLDEDRRSALHELGACGSFHEMVEALLREADPGRPETAEQMAHFLLEEVARRPDEKGLLFLAPGATFSSSLRDGLESLRGLQPETEVVVVADRDSAPAPGIPVTWVSPLRAGTDAPFLIHYGEGPAYAMLRRPGSSGEAFYHTRDRVLVEHMAFELGRDLGIPIGESA